MSVPFADKLFTFHDPDGIEITVRGWGDQHYAVFETPDGFTVTKNPQSGFFEYARLSPDRRELLPSGIRVATGMARAAAVPEHVRVLGAAAKTQARVARREIGAPRRWEVRRARRQQEQRRTAARGLPGAAAAMQPVGDYLGLCLLIDFPDVPATVSQEEVSRFCNEPGYTGGGNHGSVYDYFYDNSGGRLRYRNTVTAYYRAAHERDYYTDPSLPYAQRARELIIEALDRLSLDGFDFGQLSSDQDGYVYALNALYAGGCPNNWAEGLWPHSSGLGPYQTASGKQLCDYQITDTGGQLALHTFCHENGHMVCDFPDLYDYGGESFGIGHYCLMCYGGDGLNPTQVNAYLKIEAGWASSVTPLTAGMTASVTSAGNDFFVHARNGTELFVIENRQQAGRDASLPDSGLAIWHVDETGSNEQEQMTAQQHYLCALEQAALAAISAGRSVSANLTTTDEYGVVNRLYVRAV